MLHLAGKKIWLTGASSGIGEALAYELGRRGAVVALTARRGEALERIVAGIQSAGGRAHSFPGDVQDLVAMKALAAAIRDQLGGLDMLIANAGTHVFTVPEQFDSAEYLGLMNLNYGGMLHTIEAVVPEMLARGEGHIVGMASMAGFRGLPRAAAYGASKAAMAHFLESIRYHYEPKGLRVTVVDPGFVKTPLTDKNDFQMPFLMAPDAAARAICNGLEREALEVSFPIPFNWFMKLMRIIPFPLYHFLVTALWRRMERDRASRS